MQPTKEFCDTHCKPPHSRTTRVKRENKRCEACQTIYDTDVHSSCPDKNCRNHLDTDISDTGSDDAESEKESEKAESDNEDVQEVPEWKPPSPPASADSDDERRIQNYTDAVDNMSEDE